MSLYNNDNNKILKIFGYLTLFIVLISILYVLNFQNTIIVNHDRDKNSEINVEIIITKYFFKDIILSKKISINYGSSAMDALEDVSNVTYNYGGGFVESINGIKSTFSGGSGGKNDWFYYLNGMLMNTGATNKILKNGDILRWDFHTWDSNRMSTCIISDFPEPFIDGYKKSTDTIIVYSKKYEDETEHLKEKLNSYNIKCYKKEFSDLTDEDKKNENLIIVDNIENDLISELNKNSETLGWFIKYKDRSITTYDQYDKKTSSYDSCGFITSNQNPWNPNGNWNGENVVWVVSGISDDDVKDALHVLTNDYNDLKNSVNILIFDNKIIKVP